MKTILYIGNQLSKHGFSVTNIETLGLQLESLGFEVIYASDKKNKTGRLLHMLWSVWKHRHRVDSVLVDTYSKQSFYFALFSAWICRLGGLDYYPILHGGNLPERLKSNPFLSKSIFGHSKSNIAPSNYLKSTFDRAGLRTAFIPNNITLNLYPFKERKAFKPALLWVRSFDAIYNPQMAIQVLEKLLPLYDEATLCMVGPDKDGSLTECQNLVREKHLEDKVTFTGQLPKKEWHTLAATYDIFINTTHVDNTPVSVIEAMALGLPVVSTNVGGIPFLLNHGKDALLVPPGDTDKMTVAIKNIIDNPSLGRALSKAARKKTESFDWEVVKEQWKEILS